MAVEKMTTVSWVYVCGFVIALISGIRCSVTPKLTCPIYVLEQQNLTCHCEPPAEHSGTVTWPGHSATGTLHVPNVRRAQNGTVYKCQVVGDGGGEANTWTADYTLLVAYGPDKEKLQITADKQPFITNGSQSLTLTCEVGEVYPTLDYAWRDVNCLNQATERTCVVTPNPPDDFDGKVVACEVSRNYRTQLDRKLMTNVYTLNLNYPPLTSPIIEVQASDRELLRRGDNLTCSIRGGKPKVDGVIFSCSDPSLPDGQDVVRKGEVGVSSAVTVTSLSSSQHAMRCECRGVWSPRPEYYNANAVASYDVEHPAIVINISIGICDKVNSTCPHEYWKNQEGGGEGGGGEGGGDDLSQATVTGHTNMTVHLVCTTFGRPVTFAVSFSRKDDARYRRVAVAWPEGPVSALAKGGSASDSQNGSAWSKVFILELQNITCEDMARYICTADNGVGDKGTGTATLNVKCPPRKGWSHEDGEKRMNMTDAGISFTLKAYPVPDNFTFRHHGNRSADLNGTVVDSKRFETSCRQDYVKLYQVNCRIVPVDVPEDLQGEFTVTITNELGHMDLSFFIHTPAMKLARGGMSAGSTAGTVVSVVVSVVIIIIIVIFCKRLRLQNPARETDSDVDSTDPAICSAFCTALQRITSGGSNASANFKARVASLGKRPKGDVQNVSNKHGSDTGAIRTIHSPGHQGPTSTPIKGSIMIESDLGYTSSLSAQHQTSKNKLLNYEDVADCLTYFGADNGSSADQLMIVHVGPNARDASDHVYSDVTTNFGAKARTPPEKGDYGAYAVVNIVRRYDTNPSPSDQDRGQGGAEDGDPVCTPNDAVNNNVQVHRAENEDNTVTRCPPSVKKKVRLADDPQYIPSADPCDTEEESLSMADNPREGL